MTKNSEDDFDEIGDDDETSVEVETINLGHRSSRPRRTWRDIERLREQKEIDRLLTNDDWFDDLDQA